MKALLLAAGFGTRLRPLTDHTPKCLVEIRGKPLLAYWLELLFTGGIERVLINTHYLPEKVQQFVDKSLYKGMIEIAHEEVLLGTASTLLHNRKFSEAEALLVAHADNLTRFSVADFIHSHNKRPPGVDITMMTFDTDAPQHCGIVLVDETNIVRTFHEKVENPPGTIANAAVYIFEPNVTAFIQSLDRNSLDISNDVVPHFMGRIQTFHNFDYHRDIGNMASLNAAEQEY